MVVVMACKDDNSGLLDRILTCPYTVKVSDMPTHGHNPTSGIASDSVRGRYDNSPNA